MAFMHRLLFAAGLLFAYFAPKFYMVVQLQGYHISIYNHAPGPCEILPEISEGSEDFEMLPNGKAIISSGLRFMSALDNPNYVGHRGAMYLLDMDKSRPTSPQRFSIVGDLDPDAFNPHGISINEEHGETFVYVINHAPGDQQVNKFLVNEEKVQLTLVKTFPDAESYGVLNDLVVIADDTFYLTNYMLTEWSLEKTLGLHWGSVVLYEGGKARIVSSRLYLPNGINKSPDGKHIYLASTGETAIRVYERQANNDLKDVQTFVFHAGADNIDVDQSTGDLVTAGCPTRNKLVAYFSNPKVNQSPTQVMKFKTRGGLITDVEQVYMNDGAEFSGGSVAAIYKDRLFVGSIASKAMVCDIR